MGVTLVGFVEGRDETRAFCRSFDEVGFDVTQAALRGAKRSFGLVKLARQAGVFGARFVERGLLRALFVFGRQQTLARCIEVGFELDNALFGGGEAFVEPAVLFAQRLVLAGLLGEAGF